MSVYKDKLLSLNPVFLAFYDDTKTGLQAVGSGVTASTTTFTTGAPRRVPQPDKLPDDDATVGTDGTVQFSNVGGLKSLPNGFTIVSLIKADTRNSAWDRTLSFGRNFITSEVIFARSGNTPEFSLSFWNNSTNVAGSLVETTGGKFTVGEFHHVVGVYDRANSETRLYLNGVIVATKTGVPAMVEDNGRMSVGISGTTSTGIERLNGPNILPTIYDKVLSPAEILGIANLAKTRVLSGVAKLNDTDAGINKVTAVTSVGVNKVFSLTPNPITGAWEKEATKEPLLIIYTGPDGYLPQIHGPY